MKLARYGEKGSERPAIIDVDGNLRDLSGFLRELDGTALAPVELHRLGEIDTATLPRVPDDTRIGPPVAGIGKIVCIGLNYSDHAAEAGMERPSEPIIFLKPREAVCGPDDDTVQPPHATRLDWEVELGVVIGTTTRYVSEANALDHIAGYCVVNDVSERAFQMQSGQWDKGKGCDTFAPVGPWLVTKDEIPDPQNLDMWLDVNGERRQTGNTGKMIFGVQELVSYVSRYMTLSPGDVIATGTPPGVGMGMKPDPQWLRSGDVVELSIAGLGRQRQRIVASPETEG